MFLENLTAEDIEILKQHGMTDDEVLSLVSTLDPVAWAQAVLPKDQWPRWYQEKMLRTPRNHLGSYRAVFRCGRRIGKTYTFVLHGLWICSTNANKVVIYTAPYEPMVEVIFEEMQKLIRLSPILSSQVESMTKSPWRVKLKNGSVLKGFTAGTKSGSKGDSMRGQRADWLYLDEVDRMNDDDIDSIIGIAVEAPQRIGIWMASTPTGKRAKFYKLCTDKSAGYIEHHYSSQVAPEYGPAMEAEFRAMFTEVGYEHEVMAEWGSEVEGVFNKAHIDQAKSWENYDYEECLDRVKRERQPELRCMGVDWDKFGAASEIVITEYDVVWQKFRVIHRSEIPRGKYTLDNAVREIVRLNEIFRPAFIYADRGMGEHQVEALHLEGDKNPASGLSMKVKGIHFAQGIEVRDPVTREVVNKPLKPFMVNILSTILERGQLMLSPHDQLLWRQMEQYSVVRVTTSGTPIFSSENEHALDALMLSLLAFHQEFPELTKVIEQARIARRAVALHKPINGDLLQLRVENVETRKVTRLPDDDPETLRLARMQPRKPVTVQDLQRKAQGFSWERMRSRPGVFRRSMF